jgi:hypothetical protein
MGFSLGNLLDPGSLVSSAVKSFLPPDMQFLGGIAGALVDAQMGNPMGAISNGMSSLQDLQQNHGPSNKPPGTSSLPTPQWRAEPPPPPFAAPLLATPPAPAAPTTGGPSTILPRPGGFDVMHTQNVVMDLERRIAANAATPPGTTPAATSPAATSPAATTAPATAPRPSFPTTGIAGWVASQVTGGTTDPSKLSKDDFMALGNDAFMKAVSDGKIPKEISDSPAAMQSLQARMNNISQMNQLMTQMLAALHQMQMAIIQNVRV